MHKKIGEIEGDQEGFKESMKNRRNYRMKDG